MENNEETYVERENQWDQQWPSSDAEQRSIHDPTMELDGSDEESPFPEVVGTTDVIEAVRDAEPYTPALDPPTLPGGTEGIHVATGFGLSPDEEAAELPIVRGDEDIHDQTVLALSQDSLASQYVWDVQVDQGVVHLRGGVPSVDDAEHAASLVGNLPGVVEVVDETTLDPALS